MKVSERDWKLFREKVADWQESYIKVIRFEDLYGFSDDLKEAVRLFLGR